MAVKNLESLVLRGVHVAGGVVIDGMRFDSNLANCRMPAMDLSHFRHPSQRDPQAGLDARPRYPRAGTAGAAGAAVRAGRPASWEGVSVRRSPARVAGRTVLSGWSLTQGSTRPTAAWPTGHQATGAWATVGEELPERRQAFSASTLTTGGPTGRPEASMVETSRKQAAWFRPQCTGRSGLRRGDS
jgi:hypothetical protein